MPRKPRFFVPDIPVHVIQRGNNRQPIFFDDSDYRKYLRCLGEGVERFDCKVHTYVLMTNHVHLLLTPHSNQAVSHLMQYVGRHYVPYINAKYGRTGTLWEGRFKASSIDTRNYLLACYRYIELNPVRARIVQLPEEYRWSGCRSNALGESNTLLSPHSEYLSLGSTPSARRSSYKAMFEQAISDRELDAIRRHVQSGTPMGSPQFLIQIQSRVSVSVGFAKRGRPKKAGKGL